MNGKGSNPRPLSVSREEYRKRWDETFKANRVKYLSHAEWLALMDAAVAEERAEELAATPPAS